MKDSDSISLQNTGESEILEVLPSTPAATENCGGSGWVVYALFLCVAYMGWKMFKMLQDVQYRIHKNKEQQSAVNEKIELLNKEIERLDGELEKYAEVVKKMNEKVLDLSNKKQSTSHQKSETVTRNERQNERNEVVEKQLDTKRIKYATLQSPDENGVLRFSERTMVDSPTAQKMFQIEYDTTTGTGTYRINTAAMNLILGDLQMFKEFVKPFTFSGDSTTAIIKDKIPGKIVKQGAYWLVEELLEISIN